MHGRSNRSSSMHPRSPTCELCRGVGGDLLWRDAVCRIVLVKDRDYAGYCRVIWNAHVREMTDLAAAERERCMRVVFAVERALRVELNPHKINLASFGNMAPHLHWHVIPRFEDDPHFPNSVWGERQRPGRPARNAADTASNLRAALAASLSKSF
jgi:diadenosine tetraphosphate (Ap4A) HIT family hydrolase